MLSDRVSNPGPLTYESGALPIALRGPAFRLGTRLGVNANSVDLVPTPHNAASEQGLRSQEFPCKTQRKS